MHGAVNTAPTRECRIGRVDDDVHIDPREIASLEADRGAARAPPCVAHGPSLPQPAVARPLYASDGVTVTRQRLARFAFLVLSLIGWGFFGRALIITIAASISLAGEEVGGLGRDTYAYWLAGANALAGEPLYGATTIEEFGAYLYPPPFAQVWAPISLLPEVIADWGWRILGVLSIRYMAGSWQMAGVWWLVPGSITEISAGNVTFQMAALTVAGLRGHAQGIFPAAIVKFSSVAVVPFIWFRRPRARRGLLVGGVIAFALVALSALLGPGLWREYLSALDSIGALQAEHPSIIRLLPTAGADYLLRLVVLGVVVVASVRFDSPHLAFVAAVFLTPVLWGQKLCVLVALLTLEDDRLPRPFLWHGLHPTTPSVPLPDQRAAP